LRQSDDFEVSTTSLVGGFFEPCIDPPTAYADALS
jgi:hypothetical protein